MTTRVIDVGAGTLLGDERPHPAVDPLIWACLLQSLSAMGTYRRNVGPLVEADSVVQFVLKEPSLPRSVSFCLNGIREALQPLKHNREVLRVLNRARRRLSRFDPEGASREELHRFIDRFQLELNTLSDAISRTWFAPPE
jgi:uncharacterized alpha-E superfamily protein